MKNLFDALTVKLQKNKELRKTLLVIVLCTKAVSYEECKQT